MLYTIYKITNNLNGKTYIGKHQTKDLNDGYMGSGKLIKAAIKKYGIENFTKEILHVFRDKKEMDDKEKELVILGENSYNLKFGGEGGFDHLNDSSENHINRSKGAYQKSKQYMIDPDKNRKSGLKMKELGLGLFGISTEQRKINASNAFRGKLHSTTTKKKIGLANAEHQTGSNNSQYGTCWITNGIENKKIKKIDLIPEGWYNGRIMPSLARC